MAQTKETETMSKKQKQKAGLSHASLCVISDINIKADDTLNEMQGGYVNSTSFNKLQRRLYKCADITPYDWQRIVEAMDEAEIAIEKLKEITDEIIEEDEQ
jgi:hypothetical protein